MKTIYLIRHGKASLDGSDRERGLTPEGETQASQLAKQLEKETPKIQRLFASPFQRAILFIKPFADIDDLEIEEIEAFREISLSSEKIADINQTRQNMWADFSVKLVGGESGGEAQARGLSALQTVLDKTPDGSASAAVSHGNLIGLIINSFDASFCFDDWKNMTMPDVFRIDIENDNGKVTHVGCKGIDTFTIK
jgi:2,3-bisphosphoglycerate-dependent phosphoglycerate mutase